MKTTSVLSISGVFFMLFTGITFSQNQPLKNHLLFYSSFDGKLAADISLGDPMIYTAKNYKEVTNATPGLNDSNVVLAKNEGVFGDALHFKQAKTSAVFYKTYKNVEYSTSSWSGTVSFWLRLDPNKDLAPGYCDPICLTDVRYNDAAIWVDFTDHDPRKVQIRSYGRPRRLESKQ